MAKRVIKSNDLVEDNVFANLIKSAKEAEAVVETLTAALKTLPEIAKSIKAATPKSTPADSKGVKDLEELQRKANATTKAKLEIDKELVKEKLRLQEINKQLAKTLKEELLVTGKVGNEYQKQSATLNKLRNEYKNLAAQEAHTTKEGKALLSQITQLDTKLKSIDKSVGQSQRNVGNYGSSLDGLKVKFSSLIGVAGQFGLTLGGVALVRGSLNVLRDFDEAAADMAKTLNVTQQEAKELSRALLEIDTRTSIADLQQIAAIGGQMGISKDGIVSFTEAVDQLNVALGDEFTGGAEEITREVGNLRNVLTDIKTTSADKDLLNIGNALNVLGAAGNATAPVVTDFAGRIAGIGIPLGLGSDQVLGLSATLQELGVTSERGGTAVGKILQAMGKNVSQFADLAGMSVDDFTNLVNTDMFGAFQAAVKGSQKFKGDAVGLSKELEKLGISGSGASEVFLKLGGSMDLLNKRVTQSGEALQKTDSITAEFNAKNNTLGASVEKLSKEFQKIVLGIDSTGNVSGVLGSVMNVLIKNFDTIVRVVKDAIIGFTAFKAITKTLSVVDLIKANGGLKEFAKNMVSLKNNTDGASSAQNRLAGSIKGIGFTALIGLLTEVALAFWDVASGAAAARQQQEFYNMAVDESVKHLEQLRGESGTALQAEINAIKEKRSLNKITSLEESKMMKDAIDRAKQQTKEDIAGLRVRYRNLEAMKQEALANAALLENDPRRFFDPKVMGQLEGFNAQARKLNGFMRETRLTIEGLQGDLKTIGQESFDAQIQINELGKGSESTTKATKELKEAVKELKHEFKALTDVEKEREQFLDPSKIENSFELEKERARDIAEIRLLESQVSLEIARQSGDKKKIIDAENEVIEAKKKQIELIKQQDLAVNIGDPAEQERIRKQAELDILGLTPDKIDEVENNNERLRDIAEFTTDFIEKQIDKRIAAIDKEIEASEKREDMLRQLAINGNITASESIAEQERITSEKEKQKVQEEKRKQRVQLAKAFITSYTNALDSGASGSKALTEALKDNALAEAILNSLSSFYEGTEDTGTVSNPLDGNGGRLAVLHDNERVLTKAQNAMIGNISNDELVKRVQMSKVNDFSNITTTGWSDTAMLAHLNGLKSEMQEVKNAIINKPTTNIDLGRITQTAFEIVERTEKGNLRTSKTFKVRK